MVEDTDVPLSQIAAEFGQAVARLVDAVSEKEDRRRQAALVAGAQGGKITQLASSDQLVGALKAADALHNCQAMLRDLQAQGAALWSKFRGSSADQLWYYTSLAAITRRLLGGHPLNDEARCCGRRAGRVAPPDRRERSGRNTPVAFERAREPSRSSPNPDRRSGGVAEDQKQQQGKR